jgi:hypothetical protein
MRPPALSLFQLYVFEKKETGPGSGNPINTKSLPPSLEYLSKEIVQVAKGWPGCLQAKATVSILIHEA